MDKKEFYCKSQSFIEQLTQYCFDTKETTQSMYIAVNWLLDIQDRAMITDKAKLNIFSYYLKKPTTLTLKKLLANHCDDNNIIHFNAFSLIDTFSIKYNVL